MNKKSSQIGFTLVELIIYMGLFSILLTVLTTFFSTIVDSKLESESSTSVEQDSKYILSKLIYDIQQAESVAQPAALGTSTSSAQLVINGTTYTYDIRNNNFVLTFNGNSYELNSYQTKMNSFSVQKIGNNSGKPTLKITAEIESRIMQAKGADKRYINTTVSLR